MNTGKTTIWVMSAFAFLGQAALAQQTNPLRDAREMKRWVDRIESEPDASVKETIKDSALLVLGRYRDDLVGSARTTDDVSEDIQKNPFLTMVGPLQKTSESRIDTAPLRSGSGELGGIGSLDVTNLAVGLADFLIDRAKTELNTAFFERFQEALQKEEFKDLRLLFPETARLLNVVGTEIYRYDAFLNNMRTAFNNDLGALLAHAPDVVENHAEDLRQIGGLYPTLMIALNAAAELDRGTHPGEVVDHLIADEALLDSLKSGQPLIGNGIHLASMISESLRSAEGTVRYWATQKELEALKDETTLTIYFGLLYEWSKSKKYAGITFPSVAAFSICAGGNSPQNPTLEQFLKAVGDCWKDGASKKAEVVRFITDMGLKVNALEDNLKSLRELPEELNEQEDLSASQRRRLQFEALSAVVSSTLDIVEHAYAVERLPYMKIKVPASAKRVVDQTRSALRLAAAVDQKQYGSAITELVSMLSYAKDTLHRAQKANTLEDGMLQRLLRYGTFMASLVESETPEQAKAAIEAAALPPGSYSIKRASAFSVSLNGYLGGFYGREDVENADNKNWNTFGITAPVGVAVNWGNFPKRWKHKASLGLFVPLIDVGTLASYRLKDNTTQTVPKITLGDIVAPGLFVELGIPRTPLTIGYGWQMGPLLREVTSDSTSIVLGDFYERRIFTVKVDIPLAHFGANTGRGVRPVSASKRAKLEKRLTEFESKVIAPKETGKMNCKKKRIKCIKRRLS